jgi:two-component system sensor histidine kinase HydH
MQHQTEVWASMSEPFSDAERQRLLTQYAEIASLAGGLAHEIKNPLSTISLNLELLAEDIGEAESLRDRRMLSKVQTVLRACKNLEVILDDFLQFARAGELHLELEDFNAIVSEFMDFFAPNAIEQKVEMSPHLATDLPPVSLDRSLFRQVLLNLALNAIQAMPQGGLLELQTCLRDDQVCLDLIDNGCGMDEKTMAKMFQVFFSTKRNGSGLGLPTVRKIIEAHGGRITCQSAVGNGTQFTVTLPPVK